MRASSLTPAELADRGRRAVAAAAPPPSAISRLASASWRSSLRRSSITAASRVDHLVGRDLEQLGRLAHALVLRGEIGARAIAGQRLDAADAGGDRAFADDLEQADIAGAPHMRAAAELDRISWPALLARLRSTPIDTTRTSSPYFSPNSASAPLAMRLVGRHQMRLDG